MPLTRYQIRNEFSLADPELYRAADKDDPEALLEGVAMSGLVGVLRQLGDLAESVSLSVTLTRLVEFAWFVSLLNSQFPCFKLEVIETTVICSIFLKCTEF
ncbi:hypothetical protein ERO13_D09G164420v2 [Gossypium hirsutum]|nr:hypothetical protein ERO13_D09G164420v2 [Gossypium hirsutum]